MRKTFALLANLLVLLVVVQFLFAAVGAFSTAPHEESFRHHHTLGYVIFIVPVVMVIPAFVARMPGRLIAMALAVAGLTGLQVVIAEVAKANSDSTTGGIIAALHAVNGLAILALAGTISRRARTAS
jgi:hypothetical protein